MSIAFRQQSHQSYKLEVLLNIENKGRKVKQKKVTAKCVVCIENISKISRLDFVSGVLYRQKTRFHVLAKATNRKL